MKLTRRRLILFGMVLTLACAYAAYVTCFTKGPSVFDAERISPSMTCQDVEAILGSPFAMDRLPDGSELAGYWNLRDGRVIVVFHRDGGTRAIVSYTHPLIKKWNEISRKARQLATALP